MFIFSIILIILYNAVTLRRDISILFFRVAIIALIYSSLLAISGLYINYLDTGISLYGGLFHATSITQVFHVFFFLISALILQLTAFQPESVYIKGNCSTVLSIRAGAINFCGNFNTFYLVSRISYVIIIGILSGLFIELPYQVQVYLFIIFMGIIIEIYDKNRTKLKLHLKKISENNITFMTTLILRCFTMFFIISFTLWFIVEIDNSYINSYLLPYLKTSLANKMLFKSCFSLMWDVSWFSGFSLMWDVSWFSGLSKYIPINSVLSVIHTFSDHIKYIIRINCDFWKGNKSHYNYDFHRIKMGGDNDSSKLATSGNKTGIISDTAFFSSSSDGNVSDVNNAESSPPAPTSAPLAPASAPLAPTSAPLAPTSAPLRPIIPRPPAVSGGLSTTNGALASRHPAGWAGLPLPAPSPPAALASRPPAGWGGLHNHHHHSLPPSMRERVIHRMNNLQNIPSRDRYEPIQLAPVNENPSYTDMDGNVHYDPINQNPSYTDMDGNVHLAHIYQNLSWTGMDGNVHQGASNQNSTTNGVSFHHHPLPPGMHGNVHQGASNQNSTTNGALASRPPARSGVSFHQHGLPPGMHGNVHQALSNPLPRPRDMHGNVMLAPRPPYSVTSNNSGNTRMGGESRRSGSRRMGGESRPSGSRRMGGESRPSGSRRMGGESSSSKHPKDPERSSIYLSRLKVPPDQNIRTFILRYL